MAFFLANKTRAIIITQTILFLFLILSGVSGSSFTNIKYWAPGLVSADDRVLIGDPKPIRSDEWSVNTLLSIGQYQNSESKNPRINNNLGPSPRNMSIIHDTGVPTRELSTLAKVNLWGFFVFDLRRALAWDWWIPVFFGLNGMWLLLNLICPGQSIYNLSLALLITLAPQCVAWSNWPLLHIGTASFAVSLAIIALKSRNIMTSLSLAFLTGLLAAWFAMQLYLPRLIPVALISVLTYAGYCFSSNVRFFTRNNCVYLIYTVLIASFLVLGWFISNYDAIEKMLHSSYPGERRTYGGLPLAGWAFDYVRGWLFPITLKDAEKISGNPCEAMSCISLFIPVAIATAFYFFRQHHAINWTFLLNFGLLILFVSYEYIGLPEIVGKLTFLNRSTPTRAAIGTGLTTVILLAFLYKYRDVLRLKFRLVLFAACLVPFLVFYYKNPEIADYYKENHLCQLIYIAAFVVIIHLLFIYRIKYLPAALLLFTVPFTLLWNPLIVSPSYVKVNLPQQIESDHAGLRHGGRFLLIDVPANLFFAGGLRSMNATSHYVDSYMFDNFYSKLENPEIYNRFNNLNVFLDDQKPNMEISLGGGDWIKMRLNASDFDFSIFPIDYVVARSSQSADGLASNSSLVPAGSVGDYRFYKVKAHGGL